MKKPSHRFFEMLIFQKEWKTSRRSLSGGFSLRSGQFLIRMKWRFLKDKRYCNEKYHSLLVLLAALKNLLAILNGQLALSYDCSSIILSDKYAPINIYENNYTSWTFFVEFLMCNFHSFLNIWCLMQNIFNS